MKTVKSLLLGSAAGFVAFTGAQAADLPMAEPVEYVKVCSTYGEGFFYIPGTDTCLQISGKVRVEGYIDFADDYDAGLGGTSPIGLPEDNEFSTRARGVIAADARTETEWGTLRSYVELEGNSDTDMDAGGSPFGEVELVAAFVQFAGITAGRAPSFYDFIEFDTINDFFSSEDVWTLAYTASFGSGFAATIGIEDKSYRALHEDTLDQTWPNVIAALRVDQAWGSAQLSGAVQDNEADRDELSIIYPITVEDEFGWAVQAGAKFNLPFANEGSYFFIQGAYSEGAVSYAGAEENIGFGWTGGAAGGFFDQSLGDSGGLENNELWQVGGGVGIQASETVRLNLVGSFSNYQTADGLEDTDLILVEGNVFWTPVDNLDLGVAVLYGDAENDVDGLESHDLNVTFRIERGF